MTIQRLARKIVPFKIRNWIGLRLAKYGSPSIIELFWGIKGIEKLNNGDLLVNCGTSKLRVPWDALPTYINVYVDEPYGIGNLRRGDTVIDIGAYVGLSPRYFYDKVGNTGRVIAVEPSPDNLEYLNLNSKDTAIEVVPRALDSSDGTRDLYLGRLHAGFERYNTDSTIRVLTITLDSLIKECKLSKVDLVKLSAALSPSLDILKGATQLLSSNKPLQLLVYAPYEVYRIHGRTEGTKPLEDMLRGYGFQVEVKKLCIYARR